MPTFEVDGKTSAIFVFNHIIARFGVSQSIITNHGRHFRNVMMTELIGQLGLCHDSSTPYYPQANALWAYRTSVKMSTGFTPFQLVYGLEAVLPIECEIASLRMAIELLPATSEEERCLLYLAQLDENQRDASLEIESYAKRIKAQYDQNVTPRNFS
eukprot:PITA_27793